MGHPRDPVRVVLDLERVVLEHAFVVAELPFVGRTILQGDRDRQRRRRRRIEYAYDPFGRRLAARVSIAADAVRARVERRAVRAVHDMHRHA